MRVKVKYIGLTIITFVATASAVGFLFSKEIVSLYIPDVAQIGVIHVKLINDTSYINFKLAATNKSFLKIEIDTVKYKVSLFDKTYLQRQKFIGMTLPGNGKDTIDISLKIPYVAILKNLADARRKGDSTSYAIQVYLALTTLFGKSEISLNRAAKLKIPQVPELEIVKIKWNKIRLPTILATITIKLTNHSAITIAIKDLIYVMNFRDQGNIMGVYPETIIVKPNGESLVTISIEILANSLVKTVFDVMVNNDKYDYTLTLDAVLESVDSLNNESFHIELVKDGKIELKK